MQHQLTCGVTKGDSQDNDMKYLFAKQLMKFMKYNKLNINQFAKLLQSIGKYCNVNINVTATDIYGWLENDKSILDMDITIAELLILLDKCAAEPDSQLIMPIPNLTESLIHDVLYLKRELFVY